MKTRLWLILGISLMLVGCIMFAGVMMALNWDFTKLSTVNYETNEYIISDDVQNISIATNTADIRLISSEDITSRVVCYEQEKVKHAVTVKDGTLTIQVEDTRKWYEYVGIAFGAPKIALYLPQKEYGRLSVNTGTGNIHIEKIAAGAVDLAVSTGKVTVSNVACPGDVTIKVSTGKTDIDGLRCKNLWSVGNTGDISLKNTMATENFSIERSTGDVKFEKCDAGEISVETDTGDVTGSLLTDKVFIVATDTGLVHVPKSTTGGKCEIDTDTGDIKITIG